MVANEILQSEETLRSITASGDFCHLLITFTNSLHPDQDRPNAPPDLDPNHLPF